MSQSGRSYDDQSEPTPCSEQNKLKNLPSSRINFTKFTCGRLIIMHDISDLVLLKPIIIFMVLHIVHF